MKNFRPYYMVGIGLSAGGLKPLAELFDHLPLNLDAAFIVAGHLMPGTKSEMVNIVQRHTAMPVSWASGQQNISADHVYLLAENKMLTVNNVRLKVRERRPKEVVTQALDILLNPLAIELGNRAISIVLSGMDGDGTTGSIQIYSNGSITFAHSTPDSIYPDMPRTAILTGKIMFIRSAFEIEDLLTEIIKTPASSSLIMAG
jgi:chemotaxis response regulator CheB